MDHHRRPMQVIAGRCRSSQADEGHRRPMQVIAGQSMHLSTDRRLHRTLSDPGDRHIATWPWHYYNNFVFDLFFVKIFLAISEFDLVW